VDSLIWPLVVVIISIAAIIILRPAFMHLVDRISKAGKNGITFERPQEGESPQQPVFSFVDLMKLPITASVLEREKAIEKNFQSFDLKDETEKVSALIRALAFSRIEAEFNNISHVIFGSQLNLLVQLSGTPHCLTLLQVESLFKLAQNNYPAIHANRTLNDWLNYLLVTNLITQSNDVIDITQYGKDFLKYLVDARLAYERHG